MQDILNNPWVVGIVGGVLSGILTTIISRWVLSGRDNREYAQKIATANREIIYSIRPGIPEGALPSFNVVESIISSTARKYSVESADLLKPREIAEDLMKEVMDSSFISAKSKAEFCLQLNYLLISPKTDKVEDATTLPIETLSNYRERTTSIASMMMGLFAALVTVAVSWFSMDRLNSSLNSFKAFDALVPTLLGMIGFVLITFILFYFRNVEERRKRRWDLEDRLPTLKPVERKERKQKE